MRLRRWHFVCICRRRFEPAHMKTMLRKWGTVVVSLVTLGPAIGWSTGSSQRLCILETGSATGGGYMAAFSVPRVSEPAAILMIGVVLFGLCRVHRRRQF